MKDEKKQNVKKAEKISDQIQTPSERGFVCEEYQRCAICLKAATYDKTTTCCEDEIEDDRYFIKHLDRDDLNTPGVYSPPHDHKWLHKYDEEGNEKIKHIYRAWITLKEGGIMGIPYPTIPGPDAIVKAQAAEAIFKGKLIDIEDLGPIEYK